MTPHTKPQKENAKAGATAMASELINQLTRRKATVEISPPPTECQAEQAAFLAICRDALDIVSLADEYIGDQYHLLSAVDAMADNPAAVRALVRMCKARSEDWDTQSGCMTAGVRTKLQAASGPLPT